MGDKCDRQRDNCGNQCYWCGESLSKKMSAGTNCKREQGLKFEMCGEEKEARRVAKDSSPHH